jgi:NAD(P)-dependent dehydrogenase (short-subunit alcohol dehydrogenase family)
MAVVLITGASGGIGKMIAEGLAEERFDLILVDSDAEELALIKQKCLARASVNAICVDISDYDAIKKSLKAVKRVDVLINCAAVSGPVGLFAENDIKRWVDAAKVNFLGTAYLCHLLIPVLQKSEHGKIINFAGGGSAHPRKFHTAYASSKAAVVRFSDTLAKEYPLLDINVISPGPHKTKMWKEQIHEKEPENWGDREKLVKFFVFLCGPESSGLTGKFIHVNDAWETWDYKALPDDMYALRRVDERLLKRLKDI